MWADDVVAAMSRGLMSLLVRKKCWMELGTCETEP